MSIGVISASAVISGGGGGGTYSAAVLADSPVIYYRLGEASGTTMIDSSGNSHNGTYTGSPTLGVAGAVTGDTAATFNGSNYGDVAYGSYMDSSTALTLECWLKFTGTGLMSPIDRDTGFNRVWQWRTNAGHMDFIKIGGTGGIITGSSTTAFNNGAWHYTAVTYDGANIRLYLDGALDTTVAAAGNLGTTASPLAVAASRGGDTSGPVYNRLTGSLDEVAVYNTVLSGTQIAAHYAAR